LPEITNRKEPPQIPAVRRSRLNRTNLYLASGLAVFALALGLWLIPGFVSSFTTGKHGLSPRFFPYLVAAALGLLSLSLLIKNIRPNQETGSRVEDKRVTGSTLLCILLFFLYFIIIDWIGLVPASFLALIALMRLYGFRNWLWVFIFSVVLVVLLFFFFEKVALVPLPRGALLDGWY